MGPWRDLVHHSGRVLQSLSFAPTGAICAAATTSLPEVVGGARNWDYRYAWVRDASFTIEALWVAACPDEANQFFDYMTSSAAGSLDRGGDLQIMFGVGGERDLTERELPHLEGWRHSAPVRVGNGAWNQRQLDVYGELLSAVDRLSDQLFDNTSRRVGPMADPDKWGAPPDLAPATRRFFIQLADTAARRWQEKDQGIWEVRGEPRDYLYSKLMCWVALDRAVALADHLDASGRVGAWEQTKAKIREAILTRGWSDRAGAFTQSFGSDELDASSLMLPLVGFLPADEPRVLATINATEERLTDERGLVYRYRSHDGLDGEEGTFLLCTFWLAQALAVAGQTDRARNVFERAAAFVNDVGLLAEEADPSAESCWATSPKRSATSGSSTRPGPSRRPSADRVRRLEGRAPRRPDSSHRHRPPDADRSLRALDFDDERRESDARTGSLWRCSGCRTRRRGAADVDMKLEVVVVPVSDVDRAKAFYQSLGWRLDADFPGEGGFRVVQLTPPGSACSIIFGSGVTSAATGLGRRPPARRHRHRSGPGRGDRTGRRGERRVPRRRRGVPPRRHRGPLCRAPLPSTRPMGRSPRSAIRTATAGSSKR